MEMPSFIWMMIIPLCASPFVYIIGRLGERRERARVSQWVALTALLLTWVPFTQTVTQLNTGGRLTFLYGQIFFVADGLSLVLVAVGWSVTIPSVRPFSILCKNHASQVFCRFNCKGNHPSSGSVYVSLTTPLLSIATECTPQAACSAVALCLYGRDPVVNGICSKKRAKLPDTIRRDYIRKLLCS